MRILFLTNDYPSPWLPGKATFNRELARSLASEHEVRVVVPIPWTDEVLSRSPIPESVRHNRQESRDGCQILYPRCYHVPRFGRRWQHRFFWWSIRRTLRQAADFRPDAVLSHWAHPDGTVAVRFAQELGIPVVVGVAGSDILVLAARSAIYRGHAARTLRTADGVLAVSRHLREAVANLGVSPDRIHLAYRGVDKQQFTPGSSLPARVRLGLPLDRHLFLWVGRLVPVKGLEVLIEAARKLHDQGSKFIVALVGDGEQRGWIAEAAETCGGAIRLVGNVPHEQLADWYRAADWSVLTSHSEGVPNVLLESHACGTPFISTNVGGVSEIAVSGIDRLVPPGDADAFAEQMRQAMAGPPVSGADLPARVLSLEEAARVTSGVLQQAVDSRKHLPSATAMATAVPGRSQYRPNPWRQMVRSALTGVLPRRLFLTGGPARSRQVCLTFDDGPHPEHTPRLLDVLGELGVRATFFVVGQEAARFPNIVRRIVEEGHELGNHSWSHYPAPAIDPAGFVSEVQRTTDLLFELTGRTCHLFRPPHGKLTAGQLWKTWMLRQTVVLWNQDPKDYACQSPADITAYFDVSAPRSGGIILLHDNQPHASQALPGIVDRVRQQGLSIAGLDAWLPGGRRTGAAVLT